MEDRKEGLFPFDALKTSKKEEKEIEKKISFAQRILNSFRSECKCRRMCYWKFDNKVLHKACFRYGS